MKALITGASSGIGEAFALKFAQLGYDLIITGRRKDLLANIATKLRSTYNISVEALTVELTDDEALEKLANKIKETKNLHILVNNAGFGSHSFFFDSDYQDHVNMVKVHILAPMRLIYAALPGMIQRNEGILINVASLGGKTPSPKSATYNASKSFLQIFSESIYLENIHSNIKMQILCPGFTKTHFHENVNLDAFAQRNKGIIRWMSPEQVVNISLKNLKRGKLICIPGFWNKVLWVLADIIPRNIYYKIVTRAYNWRIIAKPRQK